VERNRALRPDVTLMDLKLPELDGVTATRMMREEFPEARINRSDELPTGDQEIYRALERPRGYLSRRCAYRRLRAIRVVHSGKRLHPARGSRAVERIFSADRADRSAKVQVLSLSPGGMANKDIATGGNSQRHHQMHVQNFSAARRGRPHARRDHRRWSGDSGHLNLVAPWRGSTDRAPLDPPATICFFFFEFSRQIFEPRSSAIATAVCGLFHLLRPPDFKRPFFILLHHFLVLARPFVADEDSWMQLFLAIGSCHTLDTASVKCFSMRPHVSRKSRPAV